MHASCLHAYEEILDSRKTHSRAYYDAALAKKKQWTPMDLVTSLPIYGQLQSATAARQATPHLPRNFFILQPRRQLLASLLIL